MDTQFDWVTWDYSGAYSPEQTRLPSALSEDDSDAEPVLNIRGSIDALSQDVGYAPDFSIDSYIISGADLTSDITVTPPVNFEVSLDQISWFTSTNSLVIGQINGVVADTSVYVRLNANIVGDFTGEIINSIDGAEDEIVTVGGSAINLIPEITLTGALEDFLQNLSTPSSSQNYRVSGVNLKEAITITAPADFEVSIDESNWSGAISIEPTDRSITNTQIFVRLSASVIGDYSGAIMHSSKDALDVSQNVAGEVIPDPGINISGEISSFTQSVGFPSASQSYTLSGTNLSTGITITPPSGYEISFSEGVWLESLTLNPLEGDVDEIILFVRLNASIEGTYNGDLVHSSVGVDPVAIAVNGVVEQGTILNAGLPTGAMEIWPNPTTRVIQVSTAEPILSESIQVYSLDGTRVTSFTKTIQKNKAEMDVSTLPKGVYILELTIDGKRVTNRIIKE